MNNPVIWFEIAASDLERAKKFYSDVFKREFQFVDMPGSPMYMFAAGDEKQGAAGSIIQSDYNTPSQDGTMIYFECDDLEVEAGRVEAAGVKLLSPKTSIGEYGFVSSFIDTEGNRIGLHSVK